MISRAWRGCRQILLDNPMVLRELTQRLGGGRLAFGIALAALVQGAALVFAMVFYLEVGQRQEGIPLGGSAFVFWSYALLIFVVCSAPMRAYGLFDWERRKESLDQHITSGSSPVVTIVGKTVICVLYSLELALAAIPFALIVSMFGGVDAVALVEAMVVAMAFAFMLLGFSVWGSMIEPEIGVAIAVFSTGSLIVLFAPLFSWEAPQLACLFPTYPAYDHFGETLELTRNSLEVRLFGHVVPGVAVAVPLYLSLGLLGLAIGAIGPTPVTGALACTYGTLISDRRRRWRRWLGSFMSRRRADLRFLYENRPGWLRRQEPILREMHALTVAVLAAVTSFGLYWHWWGLYAKSHDFLAGLLSIAVILTIAAAMRAAIPREEMVVSGGRRRLRASFWASFAMMCLPIVVLTIAGYLDAAGTQASIPFRNALVLILAHGLVIWCAGLLLSAVVDGRVKTWILQAAIAGIIALGFPLISFSLARFGIWNAASEVAVHMSAPFVISEILFDDGFSRQSVRMGEDYVRVSFEIREWLALGLAIGLLFVTGTMARGALALARRRQARSGKPLKLLAMLVSVAVVSASASAQPGRGERGPVDATRPRISVAAGFNNIIPPSGFMPITVLVSGGTVPFEGELVVRDEDGGTIIWRGEIELAAGGSRRMRLMTSENVNSGQVVATLRRRGEQKDSAAAQDYAYSSGGAGGAILWVDSRLPVPAKVGVSSSGATAQMLGAGPVQLPERAAAYWGVGAIVLGRLTPGDLEPAQLEALRQYVAAGGALILTTGQRVSNLDPAVLGDLVLGLDGVMQGALRQRVECLVELGLSREPTQEVDLADLSPLLGRGMSPVLSEAGTAIAVETLVGRGRIVVAAFDPWAAPLELTETCGLLVALLATHAPVRPTAAVEPRRQWMGDGTSALVFVILASLLALVVTSVLPYVIARLVGRPQSTWLFAPLGAGLAIVGILVISTTSLRTQTEIAVDTMTWWPENGTLADREISACLASRGRQETSLSLPGAYGALEVMVSDWRWGGGSAGSLFAGLPDAEGESTEVLGFELGRWQTRQLHGARLVDEPSPMSASLRLNHKGQMALEIEGLNQSVSNLVLSLAGSFASFDIDLPAGDHVLEVPASLRLGGDGGSTWISPGRTERRTREESRRLELINAMARAYCSIGHRYYGHARLGVRRGSSARLFAVVARPAPSLPGTQDLSELDGIDMISVPVRLELPPGADVTLPGTIVEHRVLGAMLDVSAASDAEPQPATSGAQAVEPWIVHASTLPDCDLDLRVTSVEWEGANQSMRVMGGGVAGTTLYAPGLAVQFWNWQENEWQPLFDAAAPPPTGATQGVNVRQQFRLIEGERALSLFESGSGRMLLRVPESVAAALEFGNPWDQRSGPIRKITLRAVDR